MSGVFVRLDWLAGLKIAIGGTLIFLSNSTLAQVTPDTTLGSESSVVTPNLNIEGVVSDRIDGGARRGANLFHSFQEFNVGEGRGVYFTNPQGIENILSRVTGANRSEILGRLGVLGNANLFLINPNGIVFGQNASLDIEGSFVATTAEAIALGEQGYFSATQPQQSSLLSVSPGALFFNQVAAQPENIINRGNLAVGKDLTLAAGNLDLEGQLSAEKNLTLQATDTVKIRDSVSNSFVATAREQVLVQGNQVVDILALNHPESGLFSGENMVLRSANTVRGDAYYWSGGSFRIEKLNGSLANLYSFYAPIILANGDVSIRDYQGSSLHILAGGSVTLGNVIINRTESRENTINSDNPNPFLASLANLQLSNGTDVKMDGSTRPTLDVRAGIDWTTFSEYILGNTTISKVTSLPIFGRVTSADITVNGNIRIFKPDGVVLLTNQYRPNRLAGNIATKEINPGRFSENSQSAILVTGLNFPDGNSGSVTIDGRDKITTGVVDTSSHSGNGGAIVLKAGSDITTIGYLSSGTIDGTNGGDISLTAGNNINITLKGSGRGDSIGLNSRAFDGNSGALTLTAGGNINTEELNSSSNGGNAGAITLTAEGDITKDMSDSSSFKGNGGGIFLKAGNNITTGILFSNSFEGNGGSVFLRATNGSINLTNKGKLIFNSSNIDFPRIIASGVNGGDITLINPSGILALKDTLIISNGLKGKGGNTQIAASSVSFTNTDLNNTASGFGDGGSISVVADDVVSLNNSRLFTSLDPDGNGKGGDIAIKAGSVSLINQSFIDTATFGQGNAGNVSLKVADSVFLDNDSAIFSITAGRGNGGNVKVEALGTLSLANGSNISTAVNPTSVGDFNGGNIDIEARSVSLTGGSQLVTNTFSTGKAGDITVNATEGVVISKTDPNFTPPQYRNVPVIPPRTVDKAEINNSIDKAQPLDNLFSLDTPGSINKNTEFSTTVPYVTISSPRPKKLRPRYVGNPEYYSFKIETAGTRGIFSILDDSGVDGLVLLNSAKEELISSTQDILRSNPINLRYIFSQPGTYFLRVGLSSGGSYKLTVSLDTPDITNVVNGVLASGLFARSEGNGAAGSVTINTPQLKVQEGAQIFASTSSRGQGGNITVIAPELVTIGDNSQLSVETSGAGRAGNVTLNTDTLTVDKQAFVSATSTATAITSEQGGSITLSANRINLLGKVGIFAETQGVVPAGSLSLQPYNNGQTLDVNFAEGAKVSASTSGSGQGEV